MKDIETLSDNYKRWISQELQAHGFNDNDIQWALFSGECKFCEDNEELKDAIRELWGREITSDSDLIAYISNNSNHITSLYDESGISYLIY